MVEIVDINTVAERISVLRSPPFKVPRPTVINYDLIPHDARSSMEVTWDRGAFIGAGISVHKMNDVFVTGEGVVITRDKKIVSQTLSQHAPSYPSSVLSYLEEAEIKEIKPPCLLMRKRGDHNYGHWLVEVLPKLGLARTACNIDALLIPNVGGLMQAVIIDSLSYYDRSNTPLIPHHKDQVFLLKELIVVSGATSHGTYMSPLVVDELENLSYDSPLEEKKIFVSRRGAKRDLSNSADIEEALQGIGFTILHPGELSFKQQIEAFSGASCIVGVMGAGMTNMVFAKRSAKIINLAPASMPDTFFYFLGVHKNQQYIEVRCVGADGSVDRNGKIEVKLSDLLGAIPGP